MKEKSTEDLLEILKNTTPDQMTALLGEIKEYKGKTFCGFLLECCQKYGIESNELIRVSGISRTYGYQILDGSRRPGRDKVVEIALGARFSLEDTQQLLKLVGHGILYPKNPRDALLIFCLSNGIGVIQTNEVLDAMAMNLLE